MRRRIVLLITDLEIGGTPTVVREIALRLRRPGEVHVEVACLSGWGPVADQLKSAGVHVTALGARGVHSFPLVLHRLNHLLGSRLIDTCFSFLVHANAMAAAARLFMTEVRYLQSIQTTQPDPRWHWVVQRIAHHAAQCVVVPSQSVADAAREWSGIPQEKLVIIPNAVDADDLERIPRPPPAPRWRIGFIGRLDPVKRVPDLVRAAHWLGPGVELHIWGDGEDRPAIEAEIAKLNLAGRVTLHGSVPRPAEALGQVDCLVLPSAAEGFGLVLIEAMAAGVPVVATDVPGIRDVVRDGATGLLVPPARPEKLAEAIRRLRADGTLRNQLTWAARLSVRQHYTWEPVIAQYRRLLVGPD